jgi:hypothetical protein
MGNCSGLKVFPSPQERVTGALDGGASHNGGLELEGAAQLVDLLLHEFDDMKAICNQQGPGQIFDDVCWLGGT